MGFKVFYIGGVNKGIERFSKVLMPILVVLIFAIGIFSLTLHYKDASGTVRSGLEGLKIYVIPDFKGLTMQKLFTVFVDALAFLFNQCSYGNHGCIWFVCQEGIKAHGLNQPDRDF